MRIYSMTATFGKLEHETLTLKPGLNVITAPNEWGKSTWCAFLTAMLYGLETRAKSTKTALADKERFAPWSGVPMAGRMDICWKGRDITIERSTRRRVPLGEFRAYETETGLPVEELTAANCGALLLGVEQSVFKRSGFIRQSELPVTQDEALRRRLNALVTTGDESSAADRLAAGLKDLKNRCRYNRSGLLPQAEQEKAAIEAKIAEMEELEVRTEGLRGQLEEIKEKLTKLHNHRQALRYAQAEAVQVQLAQARTAWEEARQELAELENLCAGLPSQEDAESRLRELRSLRENWNTVLAEARTVPDLPEEPRPTGPLAGLSPEEAREMVEKDGRAYGAATTSKMPAMLLIMGALGLLPSLILLLLKVWLFGAIAGIVSLLALAWGSFEYANRKKQLSALVRKYGTADVTHWVDSIRAYEESCRRYEADTAAVYQRRGDIERRLAGLRIRIEDLCGGRESDSVLDELQRVLSAWDACRNARRECQRSESHYETLRSMAQPAEKPAAADELNYPEQETVRLIAEYTAEQQRLQNRLGQQQGAMAALGDRKRLEEELDRTERRIHRLEETYAALALAQETLEEARMELQRRFAPRITKRAQELMAAMTEGRYHSLTMGADFSLQAGAGQEDVLCDAIWRSDGTVDQLYLALRLAVAEELTPGTPLILDDALVRFDDGRMKAAMEILREMSRTRQILLFSCQSREEDYLAQGRA